MKFPTLKKIAVFRALQLGDLLCTTPAFRSLRYANLNAEITLIGLPWAASFTSRFSNYIDRFIHFPGYPGLPEQVFDSVAFDAFEHVMKQEHFDLLLQMQGNGTIVNKMLGRMNAGYFAGFHNKDSRMDHFFLEYPRYGHEANRHLQLMEFLGMDNQGDYLEFPLTLKDYNELDSLQLPLQAKKYVIVHPGSRGVWRQWPTNYFALLADYCFNKGFTIVITGTTDERPIIMGLIGYLRSPFIDLSGKTSLGALGALLSNAYLLIANCTGISHMAAALDVPSVIISMDGEPERWAPADHRLHKVVDWTVNQEFDTVLYTTVDLIHQLEMQEALA